jgi:hypothetical protein
VKPFQGIGDSREEAPQGQFDLPSSGQIDNIKKRSLKDY